MSKKRRQSQIGRYSFPKSSFLAGIARILDFGGTLDSHHSSIDLDSSNYYIEANRKDAEALNGDWEAVGYDLKSAIANIKTPPAITDELIEQAHAEGSIPLFICSKEINLLY